MSQETGKATQRRFYDSRFTRQYLVGKGLDVGAGDDGLTKYQHLFPQIDTIQEWDWPQGDAQYLNTLGDNSFDFLISSHCLEHVQQPQTALANWIRVVKTGGYLIITVPDEDLYEQQQWPSRFNSDHRHTFTVYKSQSWSPVSINLVDMLRRDDIVIKKIELLDHFYDPRLYGQDQTRAWSESALEIVLQKRA